MQSMKSDHAAAFALSEEDKRRADAAMHGAKKTYAQGATVYMATQLSQLTVLCLPVLFVVVVRRPRTSALCQTMCCWQ